MYVKVPKCMFTKLYMAASVLWDQDSVNWSVLIAHWQVSINDLKFSQVTVTDFLVFLKESVLFNLGQLIASSTCQDWVAHEQSSQIPQDLRCKSWWHSMNVDLTELKACMLCMSHALFCIGTQHWDYCPDCDCISVEDWLCAQCFMLLHIRGKSMSIYLSSCWVMLVIRHCRATTDPTSKH